MITVQNISASTEQANTVVIMPDGTRYTADSNGRIQVTNPDHLAPLADAGYCTENPFSIKFKGIKTADFTVSKDSAAYTLSIADPGTLNVTLLAAALCPGVMYILDVGQSDGAITVTPAAGDTIYGNTSPRTITTPVLLYSDGISNFILL